MEIAVIGDRDFIVGFELSGVKKMYEVSESDYLGKFEECFIKENVGIIIMEEKYFKKLPARLKKKIEKTVSPVVVSISESDIGATDISALIKRSLGVDLWKG